MGEKPQDIPAETYHKDRKKSQGQGERRSYGQRRSGEDKPYRRGGEGRRFDGKKSEGRKSDGKKSEGRNSSGKSYGSKQGGDFKKSPTRDTIKRSNKYPKGE